MLQSDFLYQNDIIFRHSCLYTHHQNNLMKRKHRHIVELRSLSRSLFSVLVGGCAHSGIPYQFVINTCSKISIAI